MLKITIAGVPPYDGDYTIENNSPYNGNELRLVKQLSGVRLGEFEEAFESFDYDFLLALATIALWRAGKADKRTALPIGELLRDADTGKIKFDFEQEADAEDPPAQQPSETKRSDSSPPSSAASNGSSEEPLETIPASSGALG